MKAQVFHLKAPAVCRNDRGLEDLVRRRLLANGMAQDNLLHIAGEDEERPQLGHPSEATPTTSTANGVLVRRRRAARHHQAHFLAAIPEYEHDALFLIAALPFKAQPSHLDQFHQPTLSLDVDCQILTPLKGELIYLVLVAVAIDNSRLERRSSSFTGRYP